MAKQWQDHISNGNALVLPDRMYGVTAFLSMTQFILHGKSTNELQSVSSSILWDPIQILFHDSIGKESNRYDDAYAFSGSENQGAYLQL